MGACPLKNNNTEDGRISCPTGHCINTRSYKSVSPYLMDLEHSLAAIKSIPDYQEYDQLARAAVQLQDIIWRTTQ